MRPTPIPDGDVWEGAQRIVIGPPRGDNFETCAAVEVLADIGPETGLPRLSTRCVLEGDDLETLNAGGTVWVTFYGGSLMPFSVDVQPPTTTADVVPHVRISVDMGGDAPGFQAFMGGVPDGMSAADFAEGCAQALVEMAAEWRAAGG